MLIDKDKLGRDIKEWFKKNIRLSYVEIAAGILAIIIVTYLFFAWAT